MKTARRFRWHRGLLVDSMETTASVVSVEDFLGLVSAGLQRRVSAEDVSLTHQGMDARCGWDTYLVAVSGAAIGHMDGRLDDFVFDEESLTMPFAKAFALMREGVAVRRKTWVDGERWTMAGNRIDNADGSLAVITQEAVFAEDWIFALGPMTFGEALAKLRGTVYAPVSRKDWKESDFLFDGQVIGSVRD